MNRAKPQCPVSLAASSDLANHPYNQPVPLPFDLPTRFYAGMYVIWLLRPALQQRFPLHKRRRKDYLKFLAWCVGIGRRQYALLRENQAWNRELDQPITLPSLRGDQWQGCYTKAVYLAGIYRAGFWPAFYLHNKKIRHRATRWFFRDGRELLGFSKLPQWQQQQVLTNFGSTEHFLHAITLPKDHQSEHGIARLKEMNKDILSLTVTPNVDAMPEPSCANAISQPEAWLASLCWPITTRLLSTKYKKHPRASVQTLATTMEAVNHLKWERTASYSTLPFGVNLYGYARGELGIGEDVRMMALSLKAADIPFCIINIEPGNDVSQQDSSAEHWISQEPKYHINIFCMTGIEHCRLVCEQGLALLQNHYNIGLWPWELPQWPEPWEHSFHLVDEIWGISQYTSNAYHQAPVPVHTMPLPVTLGEVSNKQRQHWQLPEQAYLFMFSFDMNSTLARKNPAGLINAFLQAFPDKTASEVGLVLKISHLKQEDPEWQKLAALIKQDARIHLVYEELRRPDVLALYGCCNCYVSLHRAEGFGRGLAEAQLLGLQLIATGYSGNMDYCTPPTLLVDSRLTPLQPGEYFYGDGQHWAEPDIFHAAKLMQQCVKHERNIKKLKYDHTRFTPAHCGQVFKEILTRFNH
ncbi:glycosyltransferase family 1 protein [Oceanimonas pelagia]|uniref:Glycosyltransferase family 1 protein n=1 Tax=Oceanimonas pelagia TaxID=3028314 RepID=A0AA50KLK2_9GAMM|nr:glycosyltransferase [Oceanimonas pelagia]WMC09215.1 glycosyltransferase family 1 protein [Oceanimonas pelagia]